MKSLASLWSFTTYCWQHPEERFWQALRSWSGEPFIYASNVPLDDIDIPPEANMYLKDTFNWE